MTTYSLNHKRFKNAENTDNGEVSGETIFNYQQVEDQIEASYAGGSIKNGHLIGVMRSADTFTMFYHHVNHQNEIRIGQCNTKIETNTEGKMVLIEHWQWLNGDCSEGHSILVEI